MDLWALLNYANIKALAFFSILVLCLAAQFLRPFGHSRREVLHNWRVNIGFGLINALIFSFFFGGYFLAYAFEAGRIRPGLFQLLDLPYWLQVGLTVIIFDLLAYTYHRIYHRVESLWVLHRVHHCDRVFETLLAVRFHPLEVLVSMTLRVTVIGALGVPLLGLLIFEVIYTALNLIEHSDFVWSEKFDRWMGAIFITPSLHRLHHSVEHKEMNSNFGTIFTFWDRLFGTYLRRPANHKYAIGLKEVDGKTSFSLWSVLLLPFRKL